MSLVGTVAKAVLPWWLPWLAGAVGIGIIVSAYFGWRYHQREVGRLEVIASDAAAVAKRAKEDAKISAGLLASQEVYIHELELTVAPVQQVIRNAPSTCPSDAALNAVADWVRGSLASRPK